MSKAKKHHQEKLMEQTDFNVDIQLRKVLVEIFNHLDDDDLIYDYSSEIERHFRKPSGTLYEYLFIKEYTIDEIILNLKVDTVTYL